MKNQKKINQKKRKNEKWKICKDEDEWMRTTEEKKKKKNKKESQSQYDD